MNKTAKVIMMVGTEYSPGDEEVDGSKTREANMVSETDSEPGDTNVPPSPVLLPLQQGFVVNAK